MDYQFGFLSDIYYSFNTASKGEKNPEFLLTHNVFFLQQKGVSALWGQMFYAVDKDQKVLSFGMAI